MDALQETSIEVIDTADQYEASLLVFAAVVMLT